MSFNPNSAPGSTDANESAITKDHFVSLEPNEQQYIMSGAEASRILGISEEELLKIAEEGKDPENHFHSLGGSIGQRLLVQSFGEYSRIVNGKVEIQIVYQDYKEPQTEFTQIALETGEKEIVLSLAECMELLNMTEGDMGRLIYDSAHVSREPGGNWYNDGETPKILEMIVDKLQEKNRVHIDARAFDKRVRDGKIEFRIIGKETQL